MEETDKIISDFLGLEEDIEDIFWRLYKKYPEKYQRVVGQLRMAINIAQELQRDVSYHEVYQLAKRKLGERFEELQWTYLSEKSRTFVFSKK